MATGGVNKQIKHFNKAEKNVLILNIRNNNFKGVPLKKKTKILICQNEFFKKRKLEHRILHQKVFLFCKIYPGTYSTQNKLKNNKLASLSIIKMQKKYQIRYSQT